MKKLLFFSLLIIVIPYAIVSIFTKENEIKFIYKESKIVRVKHDDTGEIEEVPLEGYIVGVVAGEMPVSFNIEALKAQAVAARSYVLKKMEYSSDNDYDIVDTIMNQVYLTDDELKNSWGDSYIDKVNKIKTAVVDTKGEVITYDNNIIEAFFFSTSTGMTENSGEIFSTQLPYLVSVDSTWDGDVSPLYDTNTTYTLDEFYKLLGLNYNDNLDIVKTKTTSTGRIREMSINGTSFTATEIINKLNLRSTYFDIKQDGNSVIINVKGFGHGVGMSQYGAEAMANKGYSYDEIIKHYYTGVSIQKI